MDWTRTVDEIVAAFVDACDVVFVTRAGRRFRILAESMVGTVHETKAYVVQMMGRPVRLLHAGERCEFIFDLDNRG